LIEGYNNGYYTFYSTTFSGFTSFTDGSILYVDALRLGRSLISGITVKNCSTTLSFFYLAASLTNTFSLLTLTNVQGRIFRVTQQTTLLVNSLTISNNSCMISSLFQSGCVAYVDINSVFTISGATIANVSNVDTPGAIYMENSILVLNNFNITNSSSLIGYGCIYIVNSIANINNATFTYFTNGCLDLERSTITITKSIFNNTNTTNFLNYYGSIIYCLDCLNLMIDTCLFVGNQNNSLTGSVKKIV